MRAFIELQTFEGVSIHRKTTYFESTMPTVIYHRQRFFLLRGEVVMKDFYAKEIGVKMFYAECRGTQLKSLLSPQESS